MTNTKIAVQKHDKLKEEFIDFAQKIERLKELKRELDALDCSGFRSEERAIRLKLKDVNAIPQIVKELNLLKFKVHKNERKKIKDSISGTLGHKALNKSNKLEKKIEYLERELDKKKKVSVKKQLTEEEVNFVKDIPKLEKRLSDLKHIFSEHTASTKMKIDSGVGIIVDTKFDEFIKEIKGDLSKRLSDKEIAMNEKLKDNLNLQKRILLEKYKKVVDELHKKYAEKVDNELKEEVRRRFKEELDTRLRAMRRVVVEQLVREDSLRLKIERDQMASRLSNHYIEREKLLNKRIRDHENYLRSKLAEIEKKEKQLNSEARVHENNLEIARKNLDNARKIEHQRTERLKEMVKNRIALTKEFTQKRILAHDAEYKEKVKHFEKAENLARKALERKKRDLEREIASERNEISKRKENLKKISEESRQEAIHEIKVRELELARKVEAARREKEFAHNYIIDQRRKMQEEMNARRAEIERELDFRSKEGQRKVELSMKAVKEKLEALKKHEEAHRNLLIQKKNEIMEKVVRERKREIERVKRIREFENQKMHSEIEQMKKILKDKYHNMVEETHDKAEKRVENEVKQKEAALRKKLEQDFRAKLRKDLRKRDLELAQKKVELERHILEEAKKRIARARKLLG